ASEIKTVDDLVQVWMPSDPPASKSHRKHWLSHIEAFCAFVGHRDPRLVTREDAFRWRDALILSGMTARTVHNARIAALRALFQYAVHADVVSENPFANVIVRYDPRAFQRRAFSSAEAKMILAATLGTFEKQRPHTQAVRRWIPWICAFTGARVGEVMQLRRSDVREVEGIPVMVIDPEAGPVKGYVGRTVPLHPQLIEDGLLEFVRQRPDGPLFADENGELHRFTTPQYLAKWIRSLGIKDKKAAPLHSFRHRFKSVAREAGIQREYHQAITGHRAGRTRGDDYGEVPISALYREILKLPRIAVNPPTQATPERLCQPT
ncbi:tyrosine-type recombinase/integrase, partial [Nostoc sp. NIES-2111]